MRHIANSLLWASAQRRATLVLYPTIMSIQRCPNEVLDMVFQLLPFQSPDNAPAAVLSTMLTCPRFYAISKRHLIRVVCFRTAKQVNRFAAYLTQLIDIGTYGKTRLPIEHMAVLRKRRYEDPRKQSKPETAAQSILPIIISTAAPSLRSLVIFGNTSMTMTNMSRIWSSRQFASRSFKSLSSSNNKSSALIAN